MPTQANGFGCAVKYVMPPSHWILTASSVCLHPCPPLVASRLRSVLDWPQSSLISSRCFRPKAAAHLLLLAAHHRLNGQLHAHPLRGEPDSLFL